VAMSEITRPFAAPPGMPEAILMPLQRAFGEAFADPLYQDMAKKDKLPFQYHSPAQVQKMVTDALIQPPEVISYLKTMVMSE
jgi:tripartite-type tricarboxylate transporter receptor subunit TctC